MSELQALLSEVENSLTYTDGVIQVSDEAVFRSTVHKLAEASALGSGERAGTARYLVRAAALALGVFPASIQDVYMARGRGEAPTNFTVPAMNLRALSFEAARAVFRAAGSMQAGALLFEIARSEIGYTDQRPSEYTTNMLAAAIAEGYRGPVFIQGDHFQVSAKRYANDPDGELQAVKDLTKEAIEAGFYNIDVDTSTLVDLSQATIPEQQALNARLSAEMTVYIRDLEPEGVTVSVGGEIGEVGGKNSPEEELRAYVDGYNAELAKLAPGAEGLSKISIQTGTSHGGVVLPDGSIADVSVDFDTLLRLSQVSRKEYGMAGAVQHGASTLPQEAFGKFVESEACEVHLATNFQNILYDQLPGELRTEIYAYLDANHSDERKPDMTDEQFYYKTRKRGIGKFKAEMWAMDAAAKQAISQAWEAQFKQLFTLLGIAGTKDLVDKHTTTAKIMPSLAMYTAAAGETAAEEDTRDLAD
ncbi:MAG: class II fructose-bisphosphate aldolase [Anaerolineae bacterium]|nr:class II fructose-bisphosphate aldolase [Anaerolineae bacterium]